MFRGGSEGKSMHQGKTLHADHPHQHRGHSQSVIPAGFLAYQLVIKEANNLVPRVSLPPGGGKMRDPGYEVGKLTRGLQCCKRQLAIKVVDQIVNPGETDAHTTINSVILIISLFNCFVSFFVAFCFCFLGFSVFVFVSFIAKIGAFLMRHHAVIVCAKNPF